MAYNKNLKINSGNTVIVSGSTIQLTGSTYGSQISGTIGQFTTLTASNLVAGGVKYPTSDGDAGQILVTDGVGNLGFQDITLTINVKNLEATTITKGTPLYVTASGTSGNIAGVYRADAGNENRMPAACVANESIAAGADGLAILSGFINGVNTSAFASGDEVYVAVGGGYTNVRPTGSAKVQPLGYVEKVATSGSGVVQGPGHFWELPNVTPGHFWVGAANGVPTTVASSSFSKLAEDNTFTGTNTFSVLTASAIEVDTITAREYYTELVSASIIYQSGSTKFGDSSDDIHQFSGSIQQSGSVDNYFLGRLAVGSSTLGNAALTMDVNGQIEATAFKTNYALGLGLESGYLRIGLRNSSGIAGIIQGNNSGTKNITSGVLTDLNFREGAAFAPTSGTAQFNSAVFTHTINQTGTANGITRGLLLDSTLTSAEDYRGLEFSQNSHWAIYQSGSSAKNYFAGQVGIGTDTLTHQLTVVGHVTASVVSSSFVGNGSSLTNLNASNISTGTLAVARGGTGQTSYTNGQLLIGNTTGNTLTKATLTAGTGISVTNGAGSITIAATNNGTVTSVSVANANGFAGSVTNPSTTPSITLSTTVNGLLKGDGTSISAATSSVDYAPATSGTSILYGNGSGGFSNVTVGTGLSFSGGTLTNSQIGLTDGDKGDITVASSGTSWTIDNGVITNAKLATPSLRIGTTDFTLGLTGSTIAGLTSVTSTGFTGSLNGTATNATNIGVTDAASDTTTWVLLAGSQTGTQGAKSDSGLTYNAAENILTTATFVGDLVGNADTATSAASATSAGSVTNSVTFNNGGAGATSGTTYNGSAARTISYNTIGAPSTTGTNATGTWGINITGNAATVTNGIYTTSTNAVTNAILRNSIATSVIGRSLNSTGVPGDIQATADNQVLRRSGGVLGFGTLANASLTNSSVTIGSTSVSLGSTATTIAGLTSVTSTGFTGSLNGNASSATNATNATNTTNVALTANGTSANYKVPFANTTLNTTTTIGLLHDNGGGFTYNPSSNTLTVGTLVETSTREIKENIKTIPKQLSKLKKLNPVRYNKINSTRDEIGLIAEEVQEVYPEFVHDKGINYPKMVSVLISAVQELTGKVEKQQREIASLKSKIKG